MNSEDLNQINRELEGKTRTYTLLEASLNDPQLKTQYDHYTDQGEDLGTFEEYVEEQHHLTLAGHIMAENYLGILRMRNRIKQRFYSIDKYILEDSIDLLLGRPDPFPEDGER